MIQNRTIALTTIGVSICWAIGLLLVVATIFVPYDVGTLGIAFVATAAVVSIRSALAQHMAKVSEHLADWQAAYNVGKEAGIRRIPDRD